MGGSGVRNSSRLAASPGGRIPAPLLPPAFPRVFPRRLRASAPRPPRGAAPPGTRGLPVCGGPGTGERRRSLASPPRSRPRFQRGSWERGGGGGPGAAESPGSRPGDHGAGPDDQHPAAAGGGRVSGAKGER